MTQACGGRCATRSFENTPVLLLLDASRFAYRQNILNVFLNIEVSSG
jgi:hypothetical protein